MARRPIRRGAKAGARGRGDRDDSQREDEDEPEGEPEGEPEAEPEAEEESTDRRGGGARQSGRRSGARAGRSAERPAERGGGERGGGGGQLKPKGMALALKFALVISGVSAGLVIIMGVIVFFQTRTAIDREIDRRGVDLARQLRGRCIEYREQYRKALEAYRKKRADLEEQIRKTEDPGEKSRLSQENSALYDAWIKQDEPAIKKQMEEYLENLVYWDPKEKTVDDVINATYLAAEGRDDAKLAQARDLGGTVDAQVSRSPIGFVQVSSGVLGTKPVRLYLAPLASGAQRPAAMVFISAEQIDRTQNQLMIGIGLAILLAIAIGGGVSFLLASQVTEPVKRLVADIEIVAAGDLEHRTIPVSTDEIGLLAQTFDIMTQKISYAHGQEIEHKAREHELGIATEIQSNLLPKKIPPLPGFDLSAFYRPSKEVGGDYYDFIQIDDDNLGIIVADVAGKGIPGSMVMTMARSLIRMESVRNLSPADIFVKTNRVIAQDIKRGMFVTAMYVIINTRTRMLTVASAGHNPMVLFRASQGKCSLINPKGIALGFDKGPIFERTITEEKVKIEPGDRVVLYTDGVPEAMSPASEEYSEKRFYKLAQENGSRNSNQFVNLLVADLEKWRGDGEQSDDITICTFRRLED